MECSGVTCAPFDRERDLVGMEVYVLQWQARFFDATALVNRDLNEILRLLILLEGWAQTAGWSPHRESSTLRSCNAVLREDARTLLLEGF